MKPSLLIFDLGGVLLRIEYRAFIKSLGLDHALSEFDLLRLLTHDARKYESGVIPTDEFFRRLSRRLNLPYEEERLHAAWKAILGGEIEGMPELVEHLSAEHALSMLSNTNELHFEYARAEFPVVSMFRNHFLSYKIGALKPSPEIYAHVVRSLGQHPSELLFIDDLEKNVEGARRAGMQSILFRNVNSLKSELTKMGFTVS